MIKKCLDFIDFYKNKESRSEDLRVEIKNTHEGLMQTLLDGKRLLMFAIENNDDYAIKERCEIILEIYKMIEKIKTHE